MNFLGNKDILNLEKMAFLCSRKVPAEIVLKSYDWAKEQRKKGVCVVCSNHSQIEKDVFQILLKGKQPLILVLARSMKKRLEPIIKEAVENNRLLIISPFDKEIKRITRETAEIRNKYIIEISNKITVAYKTPKGQLNKLLKNIEYDKL